MDKTRRRGSIRNSESEGVTACYRTKAVGNRKSRIRSGVENLG